MAIFPEVYPNQGKYSFGPRFRTQRLGPTDGDFVQRRAWRSAPLYKAIIGWSGLNAADAKTVLEFIENCLGGYGSFAFYDFLSRPYSNQAIGTADGTQATWTLGCRDTTEAVIYFDGVAQSDDLYTISNRTGAAGQDQLVFSPAPEGTLVITADYAGKKYLPSCVFEEDESLFKALSDYRQAHELTILQVSS